MKKYIFFAILIVAIAYGHRSLCQQITVTVAGTGYAGYTGDGDNGRLARLYKPYDVCVDAAGNIYFTDQNKLRIRKISGRDGFVSTIAGGGSLLTEGAAATASLLNIGNICCDPNGDLYITANGNKVRK